MRSVVRDGLDARRVAAAPPASAASPKHRSKKKVKGGGTEGLAPPVVATPGAGSGPPTRDAAAEATAEANRRQIAAWRAVELSAMGVAPSAIEATLRDIDHPPPLPTPAEQEAAELAFAKRIDRDGDGVVSIDELKSYDSDASSLRGVRLATVMGAERRVLAASPELQAYHRELARSLVRAAGHGDQADVDVVLPTIEQLPVRILEAMRRDGLSVIVCRNSVADYLPDWVNQQPRGHAADERWSNVPGTVHGKEIVIATMDGGELSPPVPGKRVVPPTGRGHGSFNVVLHELGHALNANFAALYPEAETTQDPCSTLLSDEVVQEPAPAAAPPIATPSGAPAVPVQGPDYDVNAMSSWSRSFLSARKDDWDRELPYYRQDGDGPGAGADEALAESFARYYGGDPTLAWHWPHLFAFWDGNPFANEKLRAGATRRARDCAAGIEPRDAPPLAGSPPIAAKAPRYTLPWAARRAAA